VGKDEVQISSGSKSENQGEEGVVRPFKKQKKEEKASVAQW
jgi:hypothetical protein